MRIRGFALIATLLLVALPSAAQDVSGRWNASVESEFGPVSFDFVFSLDDSGQLVGSMENEFGSIPIEEGVIDGNEISFKLTLDFGQGPLRFVYTGTVEADEIQMVSTFEEPPPGFDQVEQPLTVKRAD